MDLVDLRLRLASIDRELLALVTRRQSLAAEISEAKRMAGLPTRDFEQERQVIERARAIAAELRASPSLARQMILLLIRSSLTIQEHGQVSAAESESSRRILVVGGAGKIGRWMSHFLHAQGFTVEVADPAGPVPGFACVTDWSEGAIDHDFIVVAAPLRISNEILLALATHRAPGVVFDIGSPKSPLRPGLRALAVAGAKVASIHPRFGPATELLSGRHVIFVDAGVPAEVARENPHLYFEIQSLNDYGAESLTALLYAVERLCSVVRAGDEADFAALGERGRGYLRWRYRGERRTAGILNRRPQTPTNIFAASIDMGLQEHIEAGSRMNQVILEEFRGPGNREIHLSCELTKPRHRAPPPQEQASDPAARGCDPTATGGASTATMSFSCRRPQCPGRASRVRRGPPRPPRAPFALPRPTQDTAHRRTFPTLGNGAFATPSHLGGEDCIE